VSVQKPCYACQLKGEKPKGYLDVPHNPNENAMAGDEPWAVSAEVDVRSNDPSAVTTHDLHRDSSSALETAADVAAVPG